MNKKTIVITSGGTIEPIDAVRAIRNSSSGKLGALIAEEIKKTIPTAEIYYLSSRHAVRPTVEHHWIETTSVLDVQSKIETLLTEKKVDVFIHSMAVADYTVEQIETIDGERFVPSFTTKLSSDHEQLSITLKKTPKIISLIKQLQPHVFLVGFKLLSHVTEKKLFDVGFNLLRKNRCNLVLANDLSSIKQGKHQGLLIYPEKKYDKIQGKEEIAKVLASVISKRAFCKYPRSIKVSEESKISNPLLEEMRDIGKHLYDEGYLPDVDGGTYGNMSIRFGSYFYISGRNVHKGKLSYNKVCRIEDCIPINQENVYAHILYHGKVKPSIDTAIHHAIYERTNYRAILHLHTDNIFNLPITSYNYPCGTMEERNAIIDSLHPDYDIIQMKKHGVIIMGNTLNDCYLKWEELQNHFYLSPLKEDEPIWKEWMEHTKNVGGVPFEDMLNIDFYWNIKKGNQSYGLCYIKENQGHLDFVIYRFKDFQKQRLAIGEKILPILEKIAKSAGLDLQLITKPLCGVENYYLKMGFHVHEKNADMILMRK